MKIAQTVVTNVPMQDEGRAKKFYVDVLGFKLDDKSMEGIVLLEAGDGSKLMLYQRAPSKADHTVASFVVDDIDAAIDYLVGKGVKFEYYDMGNGYKTDDKGIMTMGSSKAAWFKDTEGNILALNNKS